MKEAAVDLLHLDSVTPVYIFEYFFKPLLVQGFGKDVNLCVELRDHANKFLWPNLVLYMIFFWGGRTDYSFSLSAVLKYNLDSQIASFLTVFKIIDICHA